MKKYFRASLAIILVIASIIGGYFVGHFFDRKSESPEILVEQGGHSAPYKKDFYDKFFKSIDSTQQINANEIKGIIVNHHLLAGKFIAEATSLVKTDKSATVVIVSPNHFSRGRGAIISTLSSWQTPYGSIKSNEAIISKLSKSGVVAIDDRPFDMEHGIFNLTSFIKKTMPNATIVPIIVRDIARDKDIDAFVNQLSSLSEPMFLVGSFDFSHYLPTNVADFHDVKSLAVIQNFDYQSIRSVEIDSKPGLRLVLKYMEAKNANQFHLLENSNSAKLTGKIDAPETTSYITGYFTGGTKTINSNIALLAVGDIMLDRYVRKEIDKKGLASFFEPIARFLDGTDITLASLEGSFTDFKTQQVQPNNLKFTFDPKLVPTLRKFGFNLFNLANNHSGNFGEVGLNQSRNYLSKSDINFFGDPNNNMQISFIKEIRGTKIAFVGYNQFGQNLSDVIKEITDMKAKANFVVVMAHWGIEYQESFSKKQQDLAHQFVDAGADIIIGSHPHVIEPVEVYKQGIIFYSLGNFIFDQLSSDKTKQGLALGIVMNQKQFTISLFPFEMKSWQIHLLDKSQSDIILNNISEGAVAPQNIKDQIKKGVLNIIK